MIDPVEFDIDRLANGKGYVVTGEITLAGRIAAEDFRQHCRTLKEAQALRLRMILVETEARAYVASMAAAREAEARRIREARAAAKAAEPQQLNLF